VILGLTVAVITVINYYKNYADAVENNLALPAYRSQFLIAIFFTGLVPLLFLIKRLRRNILITFIVIVSLNWFVFYEQVYIWMTHFYRDYMPSSWSVEYSQSPIPYIAVATIIYFGLTFTIISMRKSERLTGRL
jgi:molybdopterin-containing oxidoreductase family membrane subunit